MIRTCHVLMAVASFCVTGHASVDNEVNDPNAAFSRTISVLNCTGSSLHHFAIRVEPKLDPPDLPLDGSPVPILHRKDFPSPLDIGSSTTLLVERIGTDHYTSGLSVTLMWVDESGLHHQAEAFFKTEAMRALGQTPLVLLISEHATDIQPTVMRSKSSKDAQNNTFHGTARRRP